MMTAQKTGRLVAIKLKIPDNEAYTALVTLRRLGVNVARIERSDVYRLPEGHTDEAIFNPNKHVMTELDGSGPRPGETWIEELGTKGDRYVAWRLLNEDGTPVSQDVLRAACDALLCNPAIERAL